MILLVVASRMQVIAKLVDIRCNRVKALMRAYEFTNSLTLESAYVFLTLGHACPVLLMFQLFSVGRRK